MTLYGSFFLEHGSAGSLTLGSDQEITNTTTYGGVQLKVMTDSFEEDDPKYVGDFESYDLYEPVKGKFKVRITGPTASGVLYFYDLLRDYAAIPERYWREQAPYPVILNFGNTARAILRTLDITAWDKQLQLSDLSVLVLELEYEREALLGSSQAYPSEEFLTFSQMTRPIRYPIATSGNMGFYPSPVNVQFALGRMKTIFPSGYFLMSNMEIVSVSGGMFYGNTSLGIGTSARQKILNENSNNAFSTYDGTNSDFGVLQTLPTALDTSILSSGLVYGNGGRTDTAFNVGPRDVDVYAVYKTTYSGTAFDLNLKANYLYYSNSGKQVETGYKRLPHSSTPNVAYIGRISGDTAITNATIQLDIKGQNAVSGALLIDRIVLHPVQDLHNAVLVSKLDLTSINPSNLDNSTTSGIMVAEFLSSYINTSTIPRPPRAAFRVLRYDKASKTPTYRGDINIYTKKLEDVFPTDFVGTKYARGYYNMLFLATGSAHDTVSGMRYWVLSDTFNQEVKVDMDARITEMRTNV